MRQLFSALVLLFSCLPAHALIVSAGFSGGAGMQVAWDARFSPKAQGALTATAAGRLLFARGWGIGLSAGVHQVAPSSAEGWYTYRGFDGVSLSLLAEVSLWSGGSGSRGMDAGLGAAVSAALSRYTGTSVYFFHPAVTVEPYLALWPVADERAGFRISLPIVYGFRRDLSVSASLGFSAGIVTRPGGARRAT